MKWEVARILAILRRNTGVFALLLLCALFGFSRPRFFSPDNFFNVLNAVAIFGILAVGQTFPLIGGGFDLSQGAIASLTGAITASLLSSAGLPIPLAVAIGVGLGALLGLVNGVLVARVGMNPFVATLGTQIAFFGATNVFTNNQPLSLGPAGSLFRQLSFGQWGGFSYASVLFLSLTALLAFVLRLLPFGQHVYTLGGSEEATRLAGLPTERLKVATYVLSGALAATAGMVIIARAGQASPVAGQGYELESLASCIIGGIALGGGVGGAGSVLLGVLTLGVLDNGLTMVGDVISPNWRLVIRGAIILLAAAADARGRSRR
ncbi:MAG: ABC transporter permease [Armatimonadetes bacterium]|nr:ABC transporter permease [Armatimonadota bacterium]